MKTTRHLTLSALAIGLILVSFAFFRTTTNIVNALVVPLILSVMLEEMAVRQRMLVHLACYLVVFVFFPGQMIFMLLYSALSFQLKDFALRFSLMKQVIFVLIFACLLFLSTYLTDFVFMLSVNQLLYRIAQENAGLFALLYLTLSLIILTLHTTIIRQITRLIKR